MSKIRQQRTAEQLRMVFSDLFLRELSDPRLHGLTVTDVKIDRELEHADIYVSALGDESLAPVDVSAEPLHTSREPRGRCLLLNQSVWGQTCIT